MHVAARAALTGVVEHIRPHSGRGGAVGETLAMMQARLQLVDEKHTNAIIKGEPEVATDIEM
jgi:hypothetical protein